MIIELLTENLLNESPLIGVRDTGPLLTTNDSIEGGDELLTVPTLMISACESQVFDDRNRGRVRGVSDINPEPDFGIGDTDFCYPGDIRNI